MKREILFNLNRFDLSFKFQWVYLSANYHCKDIQSRLNFKKMLIDPILKNSTKFKYVLLIIKQGNLNNLILSSKRFVALM